MVDAVEVWCSICGHRAISMALLAGRPGADDGNGLYDVECGECGVYRIGASALVTMARQSDAHRAALRRMIRAANDRGNRYCLNDGRELALTQRRNTAGQLRPDQMSIESVDSDDDAPA